MLEMKQLHEKGTRKNAERVLRQYRTYQLTTAACKIMPKVTATYTLEMPNFSNAKSSSTEQAAIVNVDRLQELQQFMKLLNAALTKLSQMERQLIALKYLQAEPMFNYVIYAELGISESHFYRVQGSALCKLAIALGVEVYA